VLLHLTNSDHGRDLMKEGAWSVSPAGEFLVRRSDNPDQQFLIEPEPDLRPLRQRVVDRLSRRPERWQDLHAAIRPEWWLPKHINEVVRELKKRRHHREHRAWPEVWGGCQPRTQAHKPEAGQVAALAKERTPTVSPRPCCVDLRRRKI
jgi:hypothetical protein